MQDKKLSLKKYFNSIDLIKNSDGLTATSSYQYILLRKQLALQEELGFAEFNTRFGKLEGIQIESFINEQFNQLSLKTRSNFFGKTQIDINDYNNTEIFAPKALEHIFEGQITSRGASGFHHLPSSATGKILQETKVLGANGVYQAEVVVDGIVKPTNSGKSTFFPDYMSTQEVIDAINEAHINRIFDKDNQVFYGYSNDLKIEFYLDNNNLIKSSFPSWPQ